MKASFIITRVYSDNNGDSHFEDVTLPLTSAGEIGSLSEAFPAKSIIFREVMETYDYNFHNAPQKQFNILLDGVIEIETSLGEKRQFGPGEVLLLEDTEGKGHRTRNITKEKRRSVFIVV